MLGEKLVQWNARYFRDEFLRTCAAIPAAAHLLNRLRAGKAEFAGHAGQGVPLLAERTFYIAVVHIFRWVPLG